MRRALLAGTGLLAVAALALSGCSDNSNSDGPPKVVASTNVWGAVATAVAGDKATVTAIYTNSDGDPHEFEPSASDTATVADASVIVMNGGHYDEYMERASQNSSGTVINAFNLLPGENHDGDDHDHDHDSSSEPDSGGDHNHGETNEHVFYDLAVVGQVATKIADTLAEKDPANATTFRDNATKFNAKITGLRTELATMKQAHNGTKVAQTEPLAGYMLAEAGLVDVAPAGFTSAVEAGQSPSAADRAAMQDLLTSRTAKALIYNTQAVDQVTEALLGVAGRANVPVVKFTETLPDGVSDYITWQQAQIAALSTALTSPPAS